MLTSGYLRERRTILKQRFKYFRKQAKYSQGDIAKILGCSRTRITAIEDENNSTEYTHGEMELLSMLFGQHPFQATAPTPFDALHMAKILTHTRTSDVLLNVIDCELPEKIQLLYARGHDFAPFMQFSPSGRHFACIIDAPLEQIWEDQYFEDEDIPNAYRLTLMVWDTVSGKIRAKIRRAHMEHFVIVDDTRIAFTTERNLDKSGYRQSDNFDCKLQVWNFVTDTIEHTISTENPITALTVSPNSQHLAFFVAYLCVLQVVRTDDWANVVATEYYSMDRGKPSVSFRRYTSLEQIEAERKPFPFSDYDRPYVFEFVDDEVLAVSMPDVHYGVNRMAYFTLRPHHLFVWEGHAGLDEVLPRKAVAARFVDESILSVTAIQELPSLRANSATIQYSTPEKIISREDTPTLSTTQPKQEVRFERIWSGNIGKVIPIDSHCILALVHYDTPFPRGIFEREQVAVCNLISGMQVVLHDNGRLLENDCQESASFAPDGTAVAYWVIPADRSAARLAVQRLDPTKLNVDTRSARQEFEYHKKDPRYARYYRTYTDVDRRVDDDREREATEVYRLFR